MFYNMKKRKNMLMLKGLIFSYFVQNLDLLTNSIRIISAKLTTKVAPTVSYGSHDSAQIGSTDNVQPRR